MKRKRHNPEQIIRKLRTANNCLTKAKPSPMSAELWRSQPEPPPFSRTVFRELLYTDPMKTNDHNECPFYATPLQR